MRYAQLPLKLSMARDAARATGVARSKVEHAVQIAFIPYDSLTPIYVTPIFID